MPWKTLVAGIGDTARCDRLAPFWKRRKTALKGLKRLKRLKRACVSLFPPPRSQTPFGICLAPKARLHASLGHRPRSLTGWGTSAESAIQTERIKVTSDVPEARARMKQRLQRLVLKLERIPGAMPQAVDDGAPLALNRYSVWERTCLRNSVSSPDVTRVTLFNPFNLAIGRTHMSSKLCFVAARSERRESFVRCSYASHSEAATGTSRSGDLQIAGFRQGAV